MSMSLLPPEEGGSRLVVQEGENDSCRTFIFRPVDDYLKLIAAIHVFRYLMSRLSLQVFYL
jgi:hypothetical protein